MIGRLLAGLAAALVLAVCLPAPRTHGGRLARVTYFTESGIMASGNWTYAGAAACSYDLALGSVVTMSNGDSYTCEDRGLLGSGDPSWIDIWGGPWVPATYGDYDTIEVGQ